MKEAQQYNCDNGSMTMQDDDVLMSFDCRDDLTIKLLEDNANTWTMIMQNGDILICQNCSDSKIPRTTKKNNADSFQHWWYLDNDVKWRCHWKSRLQAWQTNEDVEVAKLNKQEFVKVGDLQGNIVDMEVKLIGKIYLFKQNVWFLISRLFCAYRH